MPEPQRCPSCGAEISSGVPGEVCPDCALKTGSAAAGPDGSAEASFVATLKAEFTAGDGDRIGRYKILQQIGEGGCGVVYMAEQEEPVKRRVALKVIKPGMDTKEVLARFEAERQALALMDHPNIAKVLDAGATDKGRPFFVMELVRGIKLTDYCDQNRLSTRERLGLFVQVCKAIQHAHQKGIIHRDIKPSNILVTLHDGVPVPKVIDFGIAKATSGQILTDRTLFTALEQFIGTPAYMSPEQAEVSGLDIDTRSDIYSLGVLAYELLTGKTPFDPKKLMEAGINEVRRIIREQEPPRPSTCISTLAAEERTKIARRRSSDAPKLIHLVRGDLDWIVMKCLEKDRTRRYETANGLATDITRFLANEPVLARPQSSAYRLWKLARRHKSGLAAAGAIALLLIAGSITSTGLALRAKRAERAERQLREAADRARANETAARQKAQQKTRELAEILSQIEQQKLDEVATKESSAKTLAYLADALRRNPDNYRAAYRLMSLLSFRNVARFVSQRNFEGKVVATDYSAAGPLAITTSSRPGELWLWDYRKETPLAGPLNHGAGVNAVTFSPSGRSFLVTLADGTFEVWNTTNAIVAVCSFKPTVAPGSVWVATFNGEETKVVTRGRGENADPVSWTLQVWDMSTGQALSQPIAIDQGRYGVPSISFDPGDTSLTLREYTGIENSTRIVDLAKGVVGPKIAQSGRMFISAERPAARPQVSMIYGGINGSAAFNISTLFGAAEVLLPLADLNAQGAGSINGGPRLSVGPHNISPDASEMLALIGDKNITLWDVSPRYVISRWLNSESSGTRQSGIVGEAFVEWSRDGKIFLTLDGRGNLKVKSAASGQVLFSPSTGTSRSRLARLSPDGQSVVAAQSDGELRLWRLSDGKLLGSGYRQSASSGEKDQASQLAYSRDGSRIAVAWDNGVAQIWDALAGKTLVEIVTGRVSQPPLLGRDGQRLAAVADGRLRVWEARTGKPLTPALAQGDGLSFDLSADGTRLASSSRDKTAHVWDARTGQQLALPLRHDAEVTWVQFLAGDENLATMSMDRTLRIWDVKTGTSLRSVKVSAPNSGIQNFTPFTEFSLSADGRVLAASVDGELRLWDVTTGTRLSEPLAPSMQGYYWASRYRLSEDLTSLSLVSGDIVRVLDLPRPSGPAPDWLPQMAELLAGLKVTPQGPEERLALGELLALRQSILAAPPSDDPYARWARWFFADKRFATISPFSSVTIAEHVNGLIAADTAQSLQEALALEPGNVEVLAPYVRLLSRTASPLSPGETPFYGYGISEEDRVRQLRSAALHEQALAETLLAMVPQNADAWYLKAKALIRLDQPAEGLAALERANSSELGPLFWNTKGLILEKLSRADEALAAFSKAIETARQAGAEDTSFHLLQRAAFLKRQNRFTEAAADTCAGRGIPLRDTNAGPLLIDLSLCYTASLTNCGALAVGPGAGVELPGGVRSLGGTSFDVRGVILGPNRPGPNVYYYGGPERQAAVTIPVNLRCGRLHFLHGVAANSRSENVRVAKYTVHYIDHQTREIPVVTGHDLREFLSSGDAPVEASNASVVWIGCSSPARNSLGRLYKMSWLNPLPNSAIESIDFQGESFGTPFLMALTAEAVSEQGPPAATAEDGAAAVSEQTLKTLEEAVSTHPDNPELALAKVSWLERRQRTDEAMDWLREFMARAGAGGNATNRAFASLVQYRGAFFVRQHRWREAVADYEKLVKLEPEDNALWCELGPLLVQTGETARYAEIRRQMLNRFSSTPIDYIAERTVKACLLLPVSGGDLDEASKLAELAVTAGKDSPWLMYFQFAKALAAYRRNDYAGAELYAKTSLESGGERISFLAADCYMVRGMAEFKLEKTDGARATVGKGAELIRAELPVPEPGKNPAGVEWKDVLTVHILLREAEQLLGLPVDAG